MEVKNVKLKWSYENFALKKPIYFFSFVILIACVIVKLFFCTIPIGGDSVNCDMTADYWNFGKDLLNGKVLYKDLIDHKGPYLFFVYAFFVFVSSNNLLVVVLFETLVYALTVGAFYWYMKDVEISSQSKNNKIVALYPTSIFALIYLIITSNVALVNTEGLSSLCFILIWGILKKSKKVTSKMFFVIGIVLGILFNFKITSVIPYIPLFLYVCTKHIKNNKEYKNLIKAIFIGFLGFVIINIPFLIYMLANNNWSDFIKIYSYACENRSEHLISKTITFLITTTSGLFYMFSNDKIGNIMICLSSLGLCWVFGDNINYYLAFYFVIIFLEMFQFKNTNKIIVFVLLFVMIVFGIKEIKINVKINEIKNTKEIATTYKITNENILYLWEDVGYGAYSNKSFVEPYQWVPTGAFCSDEFTKYYTTLTIERLKNKQFEYVYVPPLETINQYQKTKENDKNDEIYKINMRKMLCNICSYLEENYEYVLTADGELYKAK